MIKNITLVAAARPNFMKIAPIVHELSKHSDFTYTLVHTGQHFDHKMSDTFFNQLNIPEPDINLNIGGGSHAYQTGMVMIKFEEYLLKNKTDLVIVVGDVNSTVACCISAKKCNIPVAHVEAGLRSFDRKMPEEINRILTDSISDILYTPSLDGDEQLLKEGIPKEKIVFVGNIMIDTLLKQAPAAEKISLNSLIKNPSKPYCLVTLHRPSNVDNINAFKNILEAINHISKELNIVWPIHPRSKKNAKSFGLWDSIQSNIECINPLGYHEMMHLVSKSKCVITDSGGLQEETTVLNIPCITVRENTERPITITEGTNSLAGTSKDDILKVYSNIENKRINSAPKYWDGKTAQRIVSHLRDYLN
ncbi:UDP-N-acetylglucosamine 2-epimerase (non-hydrolyzing) [Candidatus Marinamargulisbacteria bacterium SCGC AG-410-N11]|nr:UDP-N-acetylglucosamine 2-epimerase (non-hydrolyzing) [Candidatus Marinamargulisbacteria bacterium SCGC AG-410-N11]